MDDNLRKRNLAQIPYEELPNQIGPRSKNPIKLNAVHLLIVRYLLCTNLYLPPKNWANSVFCFTISIACIRSERIVN